MNEDENLCSQKHEIFGSESETSACDVWTERMLDVYLSEQEDESQLIDHLISCSSCRKELGFWHQFVKNFDYAIQNQPASYKEKAQTAKGGRI